MITTAAVVSLVASLGWLVLNWQAYKSDSAAAGLNGRRQIQTVLAWIAIIAFLTLLFRYFQL